jgi:hypothetical protein
MHSLYVLTENICVHEYLLNHSQRGTQHLTSLGKAKKIDLCGNKETHRKVSKNLLFVWSLSLL